MKRKVDFANLIKELQKSGVTHQQMADACSVTRSHIGHIAAGRVKDPSWGIGDYLIRKHAEVFRATP